MVALGQSEEDTLPLQKMAQAGAGLVLAADDPQALSVFSAEAEALAQQVLIEADVPEGWTAAEGTLGVSTTLMVRRIRTPPSCP